MTPEQLKQIALDATKKEYEAIISEMQKAANEESFTCSFRSISDGAVHQLKEAGYDVQVKTHYTRGVYGSSGTKYFEVGFSK
jgi:hypothetical protein